MTVSGRAGLMSKVCGIYPIRRLSRRLTDPELRGVKPNKVRNKVVLPAPFGPIIVTISESPILNDTLSMSFEVPELTQTSVAAIKGSP